jgi:transposase
MRFYTKQHQFYCGIDFHARTMYVCMLNHDGEILVHRDMQAGPETFLQVIAPSREDSVVAVECLLTWYWLADLCAPHGRPFVRGHARSRKALHGGQAKTDRMDARKIAVLLRGGMLPQASVSPAALRATRDLLRGRMPLMRKRAEWLGHIHNTHSQYNVPEMGKQMASKANRDGIAERFPAPAVQQSIAVDLARMDHDDRLLRALALTVLKTAKPHDAHTLYLLRTVPGIGAMLRLVLLYAIHDMQRFPRVPDFVSSCRLGKCAKAAAGKRSGTAGAKSGKASLTWAFSEAAGWCLRTHPAGQKSLARWEKTHGKGKALTGLAHPLARAVSQMVKRETAFDMPMVLQSEEGAERVSRTPHGMRLQTVLCHDGCTASRMQKSPEAFTRSLPPCLAIRSGSVSAASVADGTRGLPFPRP